MTNKLETQHIFKIMVIINNSCKNVKTLFLKKSFMLKKECNIASD